MHLYTPIPSEMLAFELNVNDTLMSLSSLARKTRETLKLLMMLCTVDDEICKAFAI